MSASTAIGLVSESLRNLLLAEWSLDTSVNVTVLAPDEAGTAPRINLFLYKVQENPDLKNLDWQVKLGEPGQLVPPPLSLNLFYLMTPYATNDTQTGNATAHMILGEAMRIFYETPIVLPNPDDPPILVNGLADAREQIKIMLNTLDLDELSRVWSTFSQPFRLSVLYEVSVVQIDQLPVSERPLAKRVEEVGVPEIRAPYQPPVVTTMTPVRGPVDTEILFQGQHLAGWQAMISVMGSPVAVRTQDVDDEGKLLGNTFGMVAPDTLPAGVHEVRVDISGLYRRTFFFEIEA